MHPEARAGFKTALNQAYEFSQFLAVLPVRVLDLGGADANGTVHDLLPPDSVIDVLDLHEGVGVTIVADATVWEPSKQYDIVIATEVFEHCENWPAIVATAHLALRKGGIFVTTCASDGRRPHGAWGALDPEPGEWYRNVPPAEVAAVLHQTGFALWGWDYQENPGDCYAWAIR